jgi:hypothetical protein
MRRPLPSSRRSLIAPIIAMLAFLAMIPTTATAAPSVVKPFRATLTPVAPSSPAASLTLTLQNQSSNQQLGSADLYVPQGLTISNVQAPATFVSGPVTHEGVTYAGTIRLRNLAIAPSSTRTFTDLLTAIASCSGGSFDWGIRAKQSNNFSGPPGNDFVNVGSPLTTTFAANACGLRFLSQPKDAQVDSVITATDDFGSLLTPPDPTRPRVAFVDGEGQTITSFTGTITVALDGGDPSAELGGTTSRTAVAGVATFDDLEVDRRGTYTLVASATGAQDETSEEFEIVQQFCPEDVDCSTSHVGNGGQSSTNITLNEFNPGGDTDTGALFSRFDTTGLLDCDYSDGTPYTEFTDFTYTYEYSNLERSATIVTIVKKKLFNEVADNGAAKIQVCFEAKEAFLDDALQPTTGPALLPGCNKVDASVFPCVAIQNKQGADAVVVHTVPASYNGDPRGRS